MDRETALKRLLKVSKLTLDSKEHSTPQVYSDRLLRMCTQPPPHMRWHSHTHNHTHTHTHQVPQLQPSPSQSLSMLEVIDVCNQPVYTLDNLPILVHQFYTDRISELVQLKHLYVVRWVRFAVGQSKVTE